MSIRPAVPIQLALVGLGAPIFAVAFACLLLLVTWWVEQLLGVPATSCPGYEALALPIGFVAGLALFGLVGVEWMRRMAASGN